MAAAKKKKTSARGGKKAKKSSSRGSRTGSSARESAAEDTFVKKYYPVFENLILFFLGMGTYWEALREYLRTEFRYRTGQAFLGFAFFVLGITFLWGSALFLILALFYFLEWLTGSSAGAAFAIFFISLLLAGGFFYLTMIRFQNVIEPRQDGKKDDWDDL